MAELTTATINDVERFWDSRPCNIRHSDAPVGSRQWSDEVSNWKYMIESHITRFAEFHRWAGKQVLEVGCGIGTDTIEFIRHGAFVDAVDLSMASVHLAQARADFHQPDCGPSALFHWSDAEGGLGHLPAEFYDMAYSFGVVHHTPHPDRVIGTLRHHLKPGGELKIMVYAKWSLKNLFRRQWEAQAGCPIVFTYTAKSVKALLGTGFAITTIEKDHIFPWKVSEYTKKNLVLAWHFAWIYRFPKVFRWLERHLGHHLLVTARKI